MAITAKTPWKDHLGDIPFSLNYFQASMWEGIEVQAKEHGNFVAFDFMGKSTTYKQFIHEVHI